MTADSVRAGSFLLCIVYSPYVSQGTVTDDETSPSNATLICCVFNFFCIFLKKNLEKGICSSYLCIVIQK